MNHVHFLVTPRIEKSRDFSANVVYIHLVCCTYEYYTLNQFSLFENILMDPKKWIFN